MSRSRLRQHVRCPAGTAARIGSSVPLSVMMVLGVLAAGPAAARAPVAGDRAACARACAGGHLAPAGLAAPDGTSAAAAPLGMPMALHDGPELDYQPAIVRSARTGEWLVVFERLEGVAFSGDLYVVHSTDEGVTWTMPVPIVASERNERHPALVALPTGGYALYYLVDETGANAFRIHAAVSVDGRTWSEIGALDLGWPTPGEVNPSAIVLSDGTLAMTYHRLGGAAFLARSTDGGRTWDRERTRVSPGNAALPRLAMREADGLYVVTYQTNPGDNDLDLWARVTDDPAAWRAAPAAVSVDVNSHDSQPLVLGNGTFVVLYARQTAGAFGVVYRTSSDGRRWSAETVLTGSPDRYDTQPHGFVLDGGGSVAMVWSHQDGPQPYRDHDVWIWSPIAIAPPGALPYSLALPWVRSSADVPGDMGLPRGIRRS